MSAKDLEAPGTREAPDWASMYRARGDEVSEARPTFTGDVFENVPVGFGDTGSQITALVLQHPCALRTDGVNLAPRLLVAEVRASSVIPFGEWKGRYKLMPLPELSKENGHFAAHLQQPYLVEAEALHRSNRIACMSQVGVNLLLQRWVHHNSRVIVPTFDYQVVTAAQFEEADLIEEWCDDRVDDSADIAAETIGAHTWLRGASTSPGKRWQDLLEDPQTRAIVRTAMRRHIKELNTRDSSSISEA